MYVERSVTHVCISASQTVHPGRGSVPTSLASAAEHWPLRPALSSHEGDTTVSLTGPWQHGRSQILHTRGTRIRQQHESDNQYCSFLSNGCRTFRAVALCQLLQGQKATARNVLHPLDKKPQYCSSDSCCINQHSYEPLRNH